MPAQIPFNIFYTLFPAFLSAYAPEYGKIAFSFKASCRPAWPASPACVHFTLRTGIFREKIPWKRQPAIWSWLPQILRTGENMKTAVQPKLALPFSIPLLHIYYKTQTTSCKEKVIDKCWQNSRKRCRGELFNGDIVKNSALPLYVWGNCNNYMQTLFQNCTPKVIEILIRFL